MNASTEKTSSTVQSCCHDSLPGDAEHVAADLPQFLGQVVVRSSPRATRGGTVTEHTHRDR